MKLQTERLTVRYAGAARPALDGVSLTIPAGRLTAVLGPNGSGKSTLLRGILGIASILRGSVELFGAPMPARRQRWRLGYVPQRQTVTGGIPSTVSEIVRSGRLVRLRPWQRASTVDRDHVRRAIEAVGLERHARDTMSNLSGGQQRRVLIARALASDADVLLMDEPTAGVDAATQVSLARTMADLAGRGVTIVLVTHEIGPVASIVTRTVRMRDGRVVHDGPPEEADFHTHDVEHHHHEDLESPGGRFGLPG